MFNSCGDSGTVNPPEEDMVLLSVSNITLFEGDENKNFTFNVNLNNSSSKEIQVDYRTIADTAEENLDFVPQNSTLIIPANTTQANIEIQILADSIREADEQFFLELFNPVNATINQAQGIGTIRNDDTFVFIPKDGYITPDSYGGYDLVWQDEFAGASINPDNWMHEIGGNGWGNEELQYYTDRSDNSFIQNGNLIIRAQEENFDGRDYTSARMITKDKQEFLFGRVDIRAILPEGQGIWPALWMLGANFSEIGWPACGEIDIMELVGHEPSIVHGTCHWGPQGQTFSFNDGEEISLDSGKFSDEFHVFSIIWEFNKINFYVDDQPYFTLTPALVNGNYPFNADFFFIFNVAVGGEWPGNPDESTSFPQEMIVDYIRVFQEN